jgi:glutathione S-transferase
LSEFELYCFGQYGNSFKAAFMLSACGCDWDPIPVDFFNGETRSEYYRENINEMGEVPVLVHGGLKISQSGAILTYLAQKTRRFAGITERDRQEILSWILFDNHKFTGSLSALRFLVAIAPTGETPVTGFLRQRLLSAARIVEKHLSDRDFMVGDGPTIADFSLSGYLFHPEAYGIDWQQFGAIHFDSHCLDARRRWTTRSIGKGRHDPR